MAARDTERVISFILYLNREDWQQGDGGELRMYGHRGAEWAQPVDVAPTPGTLLLFYSRDFDHEVLATNGCAVRWSVGFESEKSRKAIYHLRYEQ